MFRLSISHHKAVCKRTEILRSMAANHEIKVNRYMYTLQSIDTCTRYNQWIHVHDTINGYMYTIQSIDTCKRYTQ